MESSEYHEQLTRLQEVDTKVHQQTGERHFEMKAEEQTDSEDPATVGH